MDLSLLPDPDEAPMCAGHARQIGIDPVGSAIRADLLIAVEVALPWPKPVFADPVLDGVVDAVAACAVPARVLAAVPASADRRSVVVHRRAVAGLSRSAWHRDDETGAVEVVKSLLRGDLVGEPDEHADDAHDVTPELWLCTQGSHDRCCGSEGTRLAQALTGRNDLVVRRVSHTGGHRFAPTALCFPDGRMWAHLDVDSVDAIVSRTGDAGVLAGQCRGWWGADPGAAQAAERALFAAQGWGWDRLPRRVEVIGPGSTPRSASVRVSIVDGPGSPTGPLEEPALVTAPAAERAWEVEVAVSREVPTITCGAPGGAPAKPAEEYRVVSVTPVRNQG